MTIRRSAELEEFGRRARQAFEERDNPWLEEHTASGDVLAFGTDPGEVFRGRDAVLGLTAEDIAEINERAGITVEFDETEAYEAGDAGWIVMHGRFVLADGSSIPVRSLIVVVREDGEWKAGMGASENLCTRLVVSCESVLEVGVEGCEALVPAGHRAFPVALVVSDREVDELTG